MLRTYFQSKNILINCKRFNHPLLSFFDSKENWGESYVNAGRPWRQDELQNKSSLDLQKLWFVLLKERNMLMTMEEEHTRRLENMPSPERFEKVEESMENILLVIQKRNEATMTLEKGFVNGPREVDKIDGLGREVRQLTKEHLYPENNSFEDYFGEENLKILKLEREKKIITKRKEAREQKYASRRDSYNRIDKFSDDDL